MGICIIVHKNILLYKSMSEVSLRTFLTAAQKGPELQGKFYMLLTKVESVRRPG